jgi:hypothetical protein
LGDPGVDEKIILRLIFRKRDMNWIGLSQDMDTWRALVNEVMKFRIPYNAGNFLANWEPVSFSRRTLLHGVWSIYDWPNNQRQVKKYQTINVAQGNSSTEGNRVISSWISAENLLKEPDRYTDK